MIFGQTHAMNDQGPLRLAQREHPAIGVVLLSELVRDLGYDPVPALRAEGLPAGDELRPTNLIEASRELGYILRILGDVPIPELGLLAGRRHHFSVFGMWGFAMISSSTLRSAIQVGLRFIDLTHTFLRWHFIGKTGAPRMRLEEPVDLGPARRFLIERDLTAAVTLLEDLLGHRRGLVRLSLPYESPSYRESYSEIFSCELEFGADRTEVLLAPDTLDATPLQANPTAAALAEQQCNELASRMAGPGSTTRAVRHELLAVPGEFPPLAEVARRLHVSERGLRRRLAAEKASFRTVLDQVRETLARAYLRDTRLQIEEIAERLGYSDAANFTHAFRRWTGSAPGRFRADTAYLSERTRS